MRPTKSNLITTIPYLSKEYKVVLQVRPIDLSSIDTVYANIVHFTTGNDHGVYGTRTPSVWVRTSHWYVSSAVNGALQHGYYYYTQPEITPKLNEWLQINVTQLREENGFNYSIVFDGKLVHSVINTQPKAFSNVKVYVSDPWYAPIDGFVRSLSCFVIDTTGSYMFSSKT